MSSRTEIHGSRVLLTGAAGFVGANLAIELIRQGAQVHALVRPNTALWRIDEVKHLVSLHRADLTDYQALRRAVEEVRPEVIFHAAAEGVLHSRQDAISISRSNVMGTVNLLEASASSGYRKFVHIGGSSEYGAKSAPMKETDLLEPRTFYGVTKAAATLLCRQYARANGLPIVVLRVFSAYGFWESGERLIPTAILSALRDQEFDLTGPGCRRDLIFVSDVVEACLAALRADNAAGEIINIGSGEQWSNEEVIEAIQLASGRELRVRPGAFPKRLSDNDCWVADIRKAGELLGWKPRHTLRQGIGETVSWFQSHMDFYPGNPEDRG